MWLILFKKQDFPSHETNSSRMSGLIRALTGRRRMRPTSTPCGQSRLRHNQGGIPLINRAQIVKKKPSQL